MTPKDSQDWDKLDNGHEILSITSQIDFMYFSIKMISEELERKKAKSQLDAAIDKATGNNPVREAAELSVTAIEEIIRLKQRLIDDYGVTKDLGIHQDKDMLEETKKYLHI